MQRARRHPGFVTGISGLLLLCYLVASLGVVPSRAMISRWTGAALGDRYPCDAFDGCGCSSALECWTRCCCHTAHERLVWALTNGVMPPSYAHFTSQQWIAAAEAVKPGSARSTFALEEIQSDLRHGIALAPADERPALGACCGQMNGPPRSAGTCGDADEQGPSPRAEACRADQTTDRPCARPHSWMSALSCKGIQQLLLLSPPPSPPSSATVIVLPEPAPFVPPPPRDESLASRTLDTPVPPPRSIARCALIVA